MLDEILEYKYKLRLYLNSLGILASFLFGTLQSARGDIGTGVVSFIGGLYFSAIVYTLVRKQHYLWKGRGFVFFIPTTNLERHSCSS